MPVPMSAPHSPRLRPLPDRWCLHRYYSLCPYAPDGANRILLAGADLATNTGEVIILGPDRTIEHRWPAGPVNAAFWHTGYWQTWSPDSRTVYSQGGSLDRPLIHRRDHAGGGHPTACPRPPLPSSKACACTFNPSAPPPSSSAARAPSASSPRSSSSSFPSPSRARRSSPPSSRWTPPPKPSPPSSPPESFPAPLSSWTRKFSAASRTSPTSVSPATSPRSSSSKPTDTPPRSWKTSPCPAANSPA